MQLILALILIASVGFNIKAQGIPNHRLVRIKIDAKLKNRNSKFEERREK